MKEYQIKLLNEFFNHLIEELEETKEHLYSETTYDYEKDLEKEINNWKYDFKKLKENLDIKN